jgi:hypothetical protein
MAAFAHPTEKIIMADMPILVREDVARSGGRLMKLRQRFVPSGEGSLERYGVDIAAAKSVMLILEKAYPGYAWEVVADSHQGYVAIRIPTLMGGNWAYLIRGKDVTPQMLLSAGGELLERYRVPRGPIEEGAFRAAREKHSILLDRSRKIPS